MSHHTDAELRVPAESAYVAVLRMTAAGLGARANFTIDDIEDLRMAVGEACALLLEGAPGAFLMGGFRIEDQRLSVRVSVDAPGEVDRDSFGWQVLSALDTAVSSDSGPQQRAINFTIAGTATAYESA